LRAAFFYQSTYTCLPNLPVQMSESNFERFMQFLGTSRFFFAASWQEIYINLLQFGWQKIKRQTIYGFVCSVLRGQKCGGVGSQIIYVNMHIKSPTLYPSHQSRNAEWIHLFSQAVILWGIYQSRCDLCILSDKDKSYPILNKKRQHEETI